MKSCIIFCFGVALAPTIARSQHDAAEFCKKVFNMVQLSPGPLKVNSINPDPVEVALAGQMFRDSWRPDRLNETYIYIIDETGAAWITPEQISPSVNNKYVGTHRSLIAQKNKAGSNTRVVAAGEIIVKNGVISAISNRSGTLQGDASNLRFAVFTFQHLTNNRLPKNIQLYDFSKSDFNPNKVHADRVQLLSQAENANYQKMRSDWEQLMLRVHRVYPDHETPGEIDSRLIDDIWDGLKLSEAEYLKTLRGLASYLAHFTESIDHMVAESLKNPQKARNIQNALDSFIKKRENPSHQTPAPTQQTTADIFD
jgi:hypothetical protein